MSITKQIEAALKFQAASTPRKQTIIAKIAKARGQGRNEAVVFITGFSR